MSQIDLEVSYRRQAAKLYSELPHDRGSAIAVVDFMRQLVTQEPMEEEGENEDG